MSAISGSRPMAKTDPGEVTSWRRGQIENKIRRRCRDRWVQFVLRPETTRDVPNGQADLHQPACQRPCSRNRLLSGDRRQVPFRWSACYLSCCNIIRKCIERARRQRRKITRNVLGSERELRIERFLAAGFATPAAWRSWRR
jgi:hypothetical protein